MKIAWLQARVARWGWILPAAALVLLLGSTFYLERQNASQLESARRDAAAAAQREASSLAEELAAQVGSRIGALAAAKLQFTAVEDSLSGATFAAAVDSVISRLPGLSAIFVVYPSGDTVPVDLIRRGRFNPFQAPGVTTAYRKALATRRPAATPMWAVSPTGEGFVATAARQRGTEAIVTSSAHA